MPKLLTPLTCHDGSCVHQPHIIVVNSVIITLWLEISGAVLKGETVQSCQSRTEESASALCQWAEEWGRMGGGVEVAVLLLMLFGFASRQEFCFIRAWGPIRAVHPLQSVHYGADRAWAQCFPWKWPLNDEWHLVSVSPFRSLSFSPYLSARICSQPTKIMWFKNPRVLWVGYLSSATCTSKMMHSVIRIITVWDVSPVDKKNKAI